MDVKPIETRYGGYRFRSRLEARWAVFFDTLEWKWEYEPEGFKLPDGTCYLPDFFVEELGSYVEVKPKVGSEGLMELATKMGAFSRSVGRIIVVYGVPEINPIDSWRAEDGSLLLSFLGRWFDCRELIDAYTAAKSARFEHGESG